MNNDHFEHINASDYYLGCAECRGDLVWVLNCASVWPAGSKLHMSYAQAPAGRMLDDDKHAQHIQTGTYWTTCTECRKDLANILEGSHPATLKHIFKEDQDGDSASEE